MITIRQAYIKDAAGIAKVHVDSVRTTYAGIDPQDYLDKLSIEEFTRSWASRLSNPRSYVYVAEDESRHIIGFVSGGAEREGDPLYKGELYAIYLLQAYQRQGIGRLLTRALVKRLVQVGMNSMLLWVVAANPARRFYEALGGQPVKTKQIEIGGAILDEVAYGWTDIGVLLEEHGA
jgi:GNAT superfamily N-acetyltransferase